MKRTVVFVVLAMLTFALTASAASSTATGTLSVSANITSSIVLVFDNATGGTTLSGAGTNAATLTFGTLQGFGATAPTGVTYGTYASGYTATSPVNVKVEMANIGSTNATLAAELGTADNTNNWAVGATAITNTAYTNINTTFPYNTDTQENITIQIPYTSAETTIGNSIKFQATTN